MSLFISALGPSLETFLKFKNSIGIQYNASAQWCLKSLDRYNFKHGNSTVLCKSLVVGWSIERSEHSNSKCGPWISPVREFGRYLRSMGDLDAYVLEYPVSQNSFRPEVYLLSDIEIQRFFKECDSYVLRKKTPGRPYVYPALYRFLYCCGARCGEARHLRCENVHLMVLRGVTSEGKILVADPASKKRSEQEWDISIILDEARKGAAAGGPLWAIY